jgi:DNA-binding transcriptional LysR family regulator
VAVTEAASLELAADVGRGRLDLAVCFQDAAAAPREHAGARRVELGTEPYLAVVAADHPLAGREEIELAELADEPWLVPSPDGILVRACRAAGFEPRLTILTGDPLALRAVAAAGLAVSLTPRLLAGLGLQGIAMPAVRDAPERDLYAVLPEGRPHPHAEPLVAALRAAVSPPAPRPAA